MDIQSAAPIQTTENQEQPKMEDEQKVTDEKQADDYELPNDDEDDWFRRVYSTPITFKYFKFTQNFILNTLKF